MTDLEFYGDLLSQPSRSVYLFLECTGIPYTMHSIDLTKRESRTPEYLKINPQGHVPYIVVRRVCARAVGERPIGPCETPTPPMLLCTGMCTLY